MQQQMQQQHMQQQMQQQQGGNVLGKFSGKIASFDDASGYGVIECMEVKEMTGSDVFLPLAEKQTFETGNTVNFIAFLNRQGQPEAKSLNQDGLPEAKSSIQDGQPEAQSINQTGLPEAKSINQ